MELAADLLLAGAAGLAVRGLMMACPVNRFGLPRHDSPQQAAGPEQEHQPGSHAAGRQGTTQLATTGEEADLAQPTLELTGSAGTAGCDVELPEGLREEDFTGGSLEAAQMSNMDSLFQTELSFNTDQQRGDAEDHPGAASPSRKRPHDAVDMNEVEAGDAAEDVRLPILKRQRTSLGGFFARVVSGLGNAVSGALASTTASSLMFVGAPVTAAEEEQSQAEEQVLPEPAVPSTVPQAGAMPSDLPPDAAGSEPEPAHASHQAVLAATRAVFDGRAPSPADVLQWHRGQELVNEALGRPAVEGSPHTCPPLRRLHAHQNQVTQAPASPQPTNTEYQSALEGALPTVSDPEAERAEGNSLLADDEQHFGEGALVAPPSPAAPVFAQSGGTARGLPMQAPEVSIFDLYQHTLTQPSVFWTPRSALEGRGADTQQDSGDERHGTRDQDSPWQRADLTSSPSPSPTCSRSQSPPPRLASPALLQRDSTGQAVRPGGQSRAAGATGPYRQPACEESDIDESSSPSEAVAAEQLHANGPAEPAGAAEQQLPTYQPVFDHDHDHVPLPVPTPQYDLLWPELEAPGAQAPSPVIQGLHIGPLQRRAHGCLSQTHCSPWQCSPGFHTRGAGSPSLRSGPCLPCLRCPARDFQPPRPWQPTSGAAAETVTAPPCPASEHGLSSPVHSTSPPHAGRAQMRPAAPARQHPPPLQASACLPWELLGVNPVHPPPSSPSFACGNGGDEDEDEDAAELGRALGTAAFAGTYPAGQWQSLLLQQHSRDARCVGGSGSHSAERGAWMGSQEGPDLRPAVASKRPASPDVLSSGTMPVTSSQDVRSGARHSPATWQADQDPAPCWRLPIPEHDLDASDDNDVNEMHSPGVGAIRSPLAGPDAAGDASAAISRVCFRAPPQEECGSGDSRDAAPSAELAQAAAAAQQAGFRFSSLDFGHGTGPAAPSPTPAQPVRPGLPTQPDDLHTRPSSDLQPDSGFQQGQRGCMTGIEEDVRAAFRHCSDHGGDSGNVAVAAVGVGVTSAEPSMEPEAHLNLDSPQARGHGIPPRDRPGRITPLSANLTPKSSLAGIPSFDSQQPLDTAVQAAHGHAADTPAAQQTSNTGHAVAGNAAGRPDRKDLEDSSPLARQGHGSLSPGHSLPCVPPRMRPAPLELPASFVDVRTSEARAALPAAGPGLPGSPMDMLHRGEDTVAPADAQEVIMPQRNAADTPVHQSWSVAAGEPVAATAGTAGSPLGPRRAVASCRRYVTRRQSKARGMGGARRCLPARYHHGGFKYPRWLPRSLAAADPSQQPTGASSPGQNEQQGISPPNGPLSSATMAMLLGETSAALHSSDICHRIVTDIHEGLADCALRARCAVNWAAQLHVPHISLGFGVGNGAEAQTDIPGQAPVTLAPAPWQHVRTQTGTNDQDDSSPDEEQAPGTFSNPIDLCDMG